MSYQILVVDDSPIVLEFARLALEPAGWRVRCVGSGAEALSVAGATRPDLILLDVEMPEMDGPATLAALRARDHLSQIPVVFLTGHDAVERSRLATLDVEGVIAKPLDVSEMASELASLLGWRR